MSVYGDMEITVVIVIIRFVRLPTMVFLLMYSGSGLSTHVFSNKIEYIQVLIPQGKTAWRQ